MNYNTFFSSSKNGKGKSSSFSPESSGFLLLQSFQSTGGGKGLSTFGSTGCCVLDAASVSELEESEEEEEEAAEEDELELEEESSSSSASSCTNNTSANRVSSTGGMLSFAAAASFGIRSKCEE